MIQVINLNKSFGDIVIFENLNMEISMNSLNCIEGKSGIGKTTLVNILSGLQEIDSGEIRGVEGKSISYLFQEYRLLPWMTVYENLKFVLKDKFGDAVDEVINNYLELVELKEYREYYPKELSGGMCQRVSIARAVAYDADILILDEPFNGLDGELKIKIFEKLLGECKKKKTTVIMITHDLSMIVDPMWNKIHL